MTIARTHATPARPVGLIAAALLALPSACGTGISLDPLWLEESRKGPPGGDASQDDRGSSRDGSQADDASGSAEDAGSDASFEASDSLDDAVDGGDDTGEAASDVSIEAASDVTVDASVDPEVDRDPSSDVASDPGDVSGPSDALRDADGDGKIEAGDGCTVGCGWPPADYYVDASVTTSGDGSRGAPFRTINAAIEAHARAPGQARKAYVAAGTYDELLGEQFPLVLRGLSLEGAGSEQTLIVGAGLFDHGARGGTKNLVYKATMVVGDPVLPTTLSRLAVRPVGPVPLRGVYGIFCDSGNATGEVPSPAGQTRLDELSAGPGYDTSVLVVTSTLPAVTGCNLLMTRSTLTGGWRGIEAVGCDGIAVPGPVILEMGTEDNTSGNTVSWMQAQDDSGYGVVAASCVVRGTFRHNNFTDSTTGVALVEDTPGPTPSGPLHPFVFQFNKFTRLSNKGLYERGKLAFIEDFYGNRFIGVSQVVNQGTHTAVGLHLTRASVRKVRGTHFIGNDIGVQLDNGAENVDFGTRAEPGDNFFACNSRIDGQYGGDVRISYSAPPPLPPDGGAKTVVHFAVNSWDQQEPRIDATEMPPNGVEIWLDHAPPLQFDFVNSSSPPVTCPSGRVP